MAQFGVIGLGVMGANLALNVEDQGVPVAVWNYEADWIDRFLAGEGAGRQFTGAATLRELARSLERPRRILMMIKAGSPVDQTIATLRPFLEPGDVLIDGGNSWFRDTESRQRHLEESGVHFVGCGVSGGEEGARRGPSLMPGGDRRAWEPLRPILEAIAAKTESGPCVTWVGPGGSGHFVKMVHNGIEYGDMQLIAEAYDLLRHVGGMEARALAGLFARWNQGPLESFLVEITAEIFRVSDPETGRPLVDLIVDQAGQKGTGRWTSQVALELGIAIPTISAAVDARVVSSLRDLRLRAAGALPRPTASVQADLRAVAHDALLAARLLTYAQGFALIDAASKEWGWSIDSREIARIWKGGCIIRARLLDTIMSALGDGASASELFLHPAMVAHLAAALPGLRSAIAAGAAAGIPLPAMSASLAWFDALRSPSLPQNLTQAQRDYFGAHGYVRSDRSGTVHTDWGLGARD